MQLFFVAGFFSVLGIEVESGSLTFHSLGHVAQAGIKAASVGAVWGKVYD